MDDKRIKKFSIAFLLTLAVLITANILYLNLSKSTEFNYLQDTGGYEVTGLGIYKRTNVTDLASLEGKTYVIACENGSLNNLGIVDKGTNEFGLNASKMRERQIRYDLVNELLFAEDREEITFQNGEQTDDGYLYELVTSSGKYIKIDNRNVTLEDEPTKLLVRTNQLEVHEGKIVISDTNSVWCLNWYGGDNDYDVKFAAWSEADNNSHQTLFERQSYSNKVDKILNVDKEIDINNLDGKQYEIVSRDHNIAISTITIKSEANSPNREISATSVTQMDSSRTRFFYSGYDWYLPKYTFESAEAGTNLYYISTIIDGKKEYLNVNVENDNDSASLYLSDTPQVFTVDSNESGYGVFIHSGDNYIQPNQWYGDFRGYNNNSAYMTTLYLCNSEYIEDFAIYYNVSAEQGRILNEPTVPDGEQIITDNTETLCEIGNKDEHGYYNVEDFMDDYPIYRLIENPTNDNTFFTDSAENSSKTWGYQLEFKYWKSIDINGNECFFHENEPIEKDDNYIYITDINGVKKQLNKNVLMSAVYRERSNVCLFFLNYSGTVMDVNGQIQNWDAELFTPLLAVAHVYNADEMLVGSDDLYADEMHRLLTSCFKSSYDPNDPGLQIVIENILDINPNDVQELVSYEIKLGIDAEELKAEVLEYLRNENVNIQLSSSEAQNPTASIENMNTKNYDIRWYVLKKAGGTYHIDGVVIAKTENVDVRKNVYNLTDEERNNLMDFRMSDNNKLSYYINIALSKSTGAESYFDLVTSNDTDEATHGYYTYYDEGNGNYLWTVDLINEEHFILEERNIEVPGKDCIITIDVNYTDGSSEKILKNQVNTANIDGVITGTTVESIVFNNYYIDEGTGFLYLNKIDRDTSAGIENATFVLRNKDTGTTYESISDSRGAAYMINLPAGTYELTEVSAPDGYVKSILEYEFVVERTEDNVCVRSVDKKGRTKILYSQSDGILVPFVVENRRDNNTVVVEKTFKGLTAEQILSLNDYTIKLEDGTNTYTLTLDDTNVEISEDGKIYTWYIEDFNYGSYTLTETGYEINRYDIAPKLTQSNTEIASVAGQEHEINYNVNITTGESRYLQLENTYTELTDFNYRVEYYYDGVIDDSKTDTFIGQYGDVISEYTDKVIPGYRLEREVEPIQITENEELNVLKVYYVIDDSNNKTIQYTVKYYLDGEEVYNDRIVRAETVQVLEPDTLDVVLSDVNITDKYTGYSFERMDLNGSDIDSVPQSVQNRDVINVYYTKNSYTYTVEYYYNGVLDDSKTDEFTANYNDIISEYEDKNITGYKLERPVQPIKITENPDNNVMRVYYVIDENNTKRVRYAVRYYKDGEEVIEDRIIRRKTVQVLEPNTIELVEGDVNTTNKYEHYDFYKMYLNREVVDNVDSTLQNRDIIDIYYVRKNYNYKVEYYYDGVRDDSKTDSFVAKYGDNISSYLDKVIPGYKLERAVDPITISDNEDENIMRVYYVINEESTKDLKYTVKYFIDGVEVPEDTIVKTKTVQSLQPNTLEVDPADVNTVDKYTGYNFEKLELNTEAIQEVPQVVNNKDVINVYYVKQEYNYTVEYYYDGVIDNSKTDEFSAKYGDTISEYTDKVIPGYRLEREVLPIQISEDETANVMRVYYVTDDGQTKELEYTVRYFKDGVEVTSDKIVRTSTVQMLEPDTLQIVDGDINITDKYVGYRYEGMEVNNTQTSEVPTVANNHDVIDIYYVTDENQTKELEYTVRYFKDGVEVTSDKIVRTETVQVLQPDTLQIVDGDINITDKYVGYRYEKMEVNDTQTSEVPTIANNHDVIDVYYVKEDYKYTVEYYYDGVIDDSKTDEFTAKYGDVISEYTDKVITGYRLESEVLPIQISENETENVMRVYYVKQDYKYIVEYYYEGEIDDSKTDEFTAKYGDTISEYADKVIPGYRLEREVLPIQISEDETANVMRVYYVIDENQTKTIEYTVRYFKDGVEVTSDKIVRTNTVQVLQPDTLDVVPEDINIVDKYVGYRYEKMEVNDAQTSNVPTVANNHDVIDIYYVTDENQTKTIEYTVRYFKDGVEVTSDKIVRTDTVQVLQPDTLQIVDGDINITDKYVGYRYEKMEVNDTQISEVPTVANNHDVIDIYYVTDENQTKTIEYTVRYFKDGVEVTSDKIVRTDTVQVLEPDTLDVVPEDVNIVDKYVGYRYEKMEVNDTQISEVPTVANNHDVIDIYYVREDYKYTVEYYYDGVIDNSKTDEFTAKYGDTISEYTDKVIPGYKLEREVLPIQISENETENVMRVYYVKDENQTKTIEYTIRYFKDGVEVTSDKIVRTDSVQVLEPDTLQIVDGDINITDKYVGYRYEKMEVNNTQTSEVPTVANNHDVIDVYYVKEDYKYIVEYYYDGEIDDSKTDEFTAKYGDIILEYTDKVIPGYRLEREVLPIQISNDETANVMRVFYVKDDSNTKTIEYTVRYFKDGVEVISDSFIRSKVVDISEPDEIDVNQAEINITDKYTGYSFEKIQLNDEIQSDIPSKVHNKDTINVYYVSKVSKIIVKFEDRNGNTLKEDFEVEGKVYDKFDLDTVNDKVDGYEIYEKTEEGITEFEETTKTVIFRYDKSTKVVVKYVDKTTGEFIDLSKNYEIIGVVGSDYTTERKSFENYKFVESTDNTSGKMTEDVIEVIYYYEKEEVPVPPDEPDKPDVPDTPVTPTEPGHFNEDGMIDLPDTSDINVIFVSIIGIISIAGIIKFRKVILTK